MDRTASCPSGNDHAESASQATSTDSGQWMFDDEPDFNSRSLNRPRYVAETNIVY